MSTPLRNDLTIYNRKGSWWDLKDRFFEPLRRLAPARMVYLDRHCSLRDLDVLDVGCGGGLMSLPMAEAGARVVGIDVASGAIEAARESGRRIKGGRVSFLVGPAERLPYPDNCFDLIVCTDVLVHVDHPELVVAEIARVLKPGGQLYFSSIARNPLSRFVMITLAENILGLVPKGTHDPEKFITFGEIREMLARSGLMITRSTGIGLIGWKRGPLFGRMPFKGVMYQGIAVRCRQPSIRGVLAAFLPSLRLRLD